MGKEGKSFQFKLKPSFKNDEAWKTIGRPKRREQTSSSLQDRKDSNKKPDTKNTPPREADPMNTLKQNTSPSDDDQKLMAKQDPLSIPLPVSPTHSTDGLDIESNLLAAFKKAINTETSTFLEEADFPPLSPPTMKLSGDGCNNLTNEFLADTTNSSVNSTEQMDITDDTTTSSFAKTYPYTYSPDWTLSPANNYQQPSPTNTDATDSNKRRFSLCLSPFTKAFFIATGYSKLQVPEDYLELIRVIVWHRKRDC
jgi:hypothetical protein